MATEYQLTLADYLSIMRRRSLYLISIFVSISLIAVIVAIIIPPTYRATGTIIVESQLIPDNVVPTAIRNKLDDQISNVMQRIMSRESLLQLADKNKVFSEDAGTLTTTVLVEKMRQRIFIEPDNPGNTMRTNRQGQLTLAFNLSYEDRHSDVAFRVASDLLALFLEWNAKLRTEGATEATAFLTQESDKLKIEVDRLEKLIADYKQEHKNALPEQLTLRMTMLSRAENDLREVERDTRTTKEEIRTLEVELAAAKRSLGTDDNPTQSLPALKAELVRLSSIYKETHPDIKRLKRKIEAAERAADAPTSTSDAGNIPSLAVYKIQARIDSDKTRLNSLDQQRVMLLAKISQNESAMIQTPKVAQGLDVLIRDRDIAQKKFEEFRSKRMNAKIAENLESDNKSGNFSVLEQPIFPEKPFKPNRLKIILIGLLLAIASAGGVVMLLEILDKRIYGTEALTHEMNLRPLAVIPYIYVEEDVFQKAQRKNLLMKSTYTAIALLLVFLVLAHFLYMPLDTMFIKILARLG